MKIYGYTIPAGGTEVIYTAGRFVRGISGRYRYDLQIDEGSATAFETGIAYEANRPFSSIRITNTHDHEQFIELAVADGYVDDNRMVASLQVTGGLDVSGSVVEIEKDVTVTGSVDVTGSGVAVVGVAKVASYGTGRLVMSRESVGGSAELVSGVNDGKRSVLLKSDDPFLIGNQGVTVETGFPVEGSITLETRAAVYAVSAVSTVVHVLEEFN